MEYRHAVVVNLYRVIIVDYLHAFTDIFGRHAVVVLEECKVAVASYGQHLALLHRITLCWQRTLTFLFYLKKSLATAVGTVRHLLVIERLQCLPYLSVERSKTMELPILNRRVNLPVCKLDGIFHKCLVLRMAHSCRIDSTVIVLGKGSEILLYDWLHTVSLYDGSLQIVWNKGCWRTTEIV